LSRDVADFARHELSQHRTGTHAMAPLIRSLTSALLLTFSLQKSKNGESKNFLILRESLNCP
jgi:hypothetical protein